MKINFKKVLIILIMAILVEVFVFNITSFRLLFGDYERKEINISLLEENDGYAYMEAAGIDTKVGTVKVIFSDDACSMDYRINYSDETSTEYRSLPEKYYVEGEERTQYIPVYLSGKTNKLCLVTHASYYELEMIDKIVVNEDIPIDILPAILCRRKSPNSPTFLTGICRSAVSPRLRSARILPGCLQGRMCCYWHIMPILT